MPTDPLTASRYPSAGDSPNIAQFFQNAVSDLSDNTFAGPFASTTARNTAFASWVSAGNTMRDGLHCHVTGVGDQVYLSGAWRTASTGVTAGRFWSFPRTGNASDSFAAGSLVSVLTGTVTAAPPGDYAITARLVISSTAAVAGFQRIQANGVAIGAETDPRADTLVVGGRNVFVQTAGYTHTSGNLALIAYYNASTGTPTVWSQGTEFTVFYLGPR